MTKIIRRAVVFSFALLVASSVVQAQAIRVGRLEAAEPLFLFSGAQVVVDWSSPATAAGEVNTATVGWAKATTPCEGIFYVDFFESAGNSFGAVRTAERGPFRAENGMNTVTLTPPVTVTRETYAGIRRAAGAPDSCGQVAMTAASRRRDRGFYATSDFSCCNFNGLGQLPDTHIQVQASNVASVRAATLPVVGSGPGSNGSFFRTSLTLANPGTTAIHGKLLLHPAGKSGSDADPSLAFDLQPKATLNYDDVLAAMNQAGNGSLDILTTGSATPLASARVFNDTGASGTSGLTEEAVRADTVNYSAANVFIPSDLTNFRLNVGVRTFSPITLNVQIYNSDGQMVGTLQKSYAANFFEQVPVSAFLNGATVPPGGRIVALVFGSTSSSSPNSEFIIYGAVTDNRTNDPSLRIGLE